MLVARIGTDFTDNHVPSVPVRVVERDENNNARTYFAPTPTPPLLCTATPTPAQ